MINYANNSVLKEKMTIMRRSPDAFSITTTRFTDGHRGTIKLTGHSRSIATTTYFPSISAATIIQVILVVIPSKSRAIPPSWLHLQA